MFKEFISRKPSQPTIFDMNANEGFSIFNQRLPSAIETYFLIVEKLGSGLKWDPWFPKEVREDKRKLIWYEGRIKYKGDDIDKKPLRIAVNL